MKTLPFRRTLPTSGPRPWSIAALALATAVTAPAAVSAATTAETAAATSITPTLEDAAAVAWGVRDITIAPLNVVPIDDAVTTIDVPLGDQVVTLRLVPHSIRTENFQLIAAIADGVLVDVDPAPARTVRGVVDGDPGSAVAGSILDDGLHASVLLADGSRWWIEAAGDQLPGAGFADHVIYRNEDILPVQRSCGLPGAAAGLMAERPVPVAAPASDAPEGGGPTLCVAELANDADFEYFQDYGSVNAVQDRIELVINTMNLQYETEVGITHVISATIVRTNVNDPFVNTDSFGLLCDFITEWTNNQGDIQRDVAHLWTGRDVDGGTIGRAADIGNTGICTPNGGCSGGTFGTFGSYCFSQSDFNNNFGCATDLTAHELGHLWGAFHCSCPTRTMNPSITCANTFEETVTRPSIEAYRDTRGCLDCQTAVSFSFPDGLPEVVDPSGGTTVRVVVEPGLGVPIPGTGVLTVSYEDVVFEIPMTEVSPNVYDAVFPPAACPLEVSYFFGVEVSGFGIITSPDDGASFTAVAAASIALTFDDDGETDPGWTVVNGAGLTDGAWTRGVPAGGGDRGDPAQDGDGSGACWLTDNVDGNSDVDGGATTLVSPILDATGENVSVSYLRWYDNTFGDAPNADVFTVEISADGGATWELLESVGPGGPQASGGWFPASFRLSEIGIPPTDQLRLRFTAEDAGAGSVVEAGVDAIRVVDADCNAATPCPADVDGSGEVAFDDLLAVLSAFGPCDACPEDVDLDGAVAFSDLLAVLAAFGPCPE
jgi:hypothetical protein